MLSRTEHEKNEHDKRFYNLGAKSGQQDAINQATKRSDNFRFNLSLMIAILIQTRDISSPVFS